MSGTKEHRHTSKNHALVVGHHPPLVHTQEPHSWECSTFEKILREINKCLLDTANISSNNMTVHQDRRNLRKILWKSSKMRALVPTLVSLQVMLMHPKRRIQVILAFLVVLGLFSYVVITPSSNNSVKNLEPKREAFKGNFLLKVKLQTWAA